MAAITLDRISKRYPTGHHAVRDCTVHIKDGEFVVLVGPSGCGKSTLLRVVAGLETPSDGRVLIDGNDVTQTAPQARDLAMVFQSYALYPHMTVRDNLAYGLRVRKVEGADIARRIGIVADALDLGTLLDRRPSQLSGGQRQRVALGRAMVREPRAFLFDEPLSNLDPALRSNARAELLRLHRRLDTTIVYVTHDQEEAMTLAHRVAVMRSGVIEQYAPPLEVYTRPVNTFVAQFIGTPPMNLLPAPIKGVATDARVAHVGVRPHDVVIASESAGQFPAAVDLVEPRGHDAVVHLTTADWPIVAVVPAHEAPAPQQQVTVGFRAGTTHWFDRAGQAIRV